MKFTAILLIVFFVISCGSEKSQKAKEPEKTIDVAKSEKTKEVKMNEIDKIINPHTWSSVEDVKLVCKANLKSAKLVRQKIISTDFKNAIEVLKLVNRIFVRMDRIIPLSDLMANVHPSKAVRGEAENCQQEAKKFLTDLMLDKNIYDKITSADNAGLSKKAMRFYKHLIRDFKRSGVDKDEKTREKLASLHEKMVKAGQEFARNIREDQKTIKVKLEDLAGMPEDFIKSHEPDDKGLVTLTTDYTDFFPVQNYAKSDEVRKSLYIKFLSRAYPANESVFLTLLKLRYEYASLLGYPDWAAYNAEDKMAKNKENIKDLIEKVVSIARGRMESDLEEILKRKKKDIPDAVAVNVWDRYYYVNKIKNEDYKVNSQEVRSYFDFKDVKEGILKINEELFELKFIKADEKDVWHKDVEVYDVIEKGKKIARFYLDMHPRKDKYGHAAMFQMVSGVQNFQIPSACLVCNFPESENGKPALMEHDQVSTFFHEFGHLMHHLLSRGHKWMEFSGIACEWDFVEAPSQIMEEWSWDPKILARFALNHETQKPIPAQLVEKMKKAEGFGKGIHVMRQMYYAALSFNYHNRNSEGVDLLGMVKDMQLKYSPYPYIPGTYTYANFGHLEGYSSMYYTYMWSLVLAKDLFTRFEKAGLMDHKTSMDFRKTVLEQGGAVDASDMVSAFLGREKSFSAFEEWLKK